MVGPEIWSVRAVSHFLIIGLETEDKKHYASHMSGLNCHRGWTFTRGDNWIRVVFVFKISNASMFLFFFFHPNLASKTWKETTIRTKERKQNHKALDSINARRLCPSGECIQKLQVGREREDKMAAPRTTVGVRWGSRIRYVATLWN